MKKTLSVITSLMLVFVLLTSVFVINVSAASDYVVENGVLTKYNGKETAVTIPVGVFYIADSVFEGNTKITSVDLNGASVIGNKAFYGCTSLKTVTDSEHVSACGAYAFFGTPYLESNKAETVTIGSVLLKGRASGKVTLPDNISAIAPYAFSYNTNITSVTIGDNIVSIGEGAFFECTKLKNVSVSKSVSHIGAYAFDSTEFLNSYTGDFLILGNGILVSSNVTSSKVNIPETVREIAAGAFYLNNTMKKVTIPNSVTGISMRAFAKCSSLESVTLPESLIILDKEAFWNCSSLKNITVPSSVKIIGDSVFLGCTSITKASYYSDAPVSNGLFAGCTSLESVIIASETTSLGQYAFYSCPSLNEISVPDTVKDISNDTFDTENSLSVFCNSSSYAYKTLGDGGIDVYQIGDANLDGKLDVRDATHIQKATASLLTLDFSSTLRGDADFSGVVNIRDATMVQKLVAGII